MSPKTALIFIDPYNEFLHPEGKLHARLSDSLAKTNCIAHMRSVLQTARANSIPVFYCMHQQTHDTTFKGWTTLNKNHENMRGNQVFRVGSFGVEYFEGMEPDVAAGDVVVSKHWNSRYVFDADR